MWTLHTRHFTVAVTCFFATHAKPSQFWVRVSLEENTFTQCRTRQTLTFLRPRFSPSSDGVYLSAVFSQLHNWINAGPVRILLVHFVTGGKHKTVHCDSVSKQLIFHQPLFRLSASPLNTVSSPLSLNRPLKRVLVFFWTTWGICVNRREHFADCSKLLWYSNESTYVNKISRRVNECLGPSVLSKGWPTLYQTHTKTHTHTASVLAFYKQLWTREWARVYQITLALIRQSSTDTWIYLDSGRLCLDITEWRAPLNTERPG